MRSILLLTVFAVWMAPSWADQIIVGPNNAPFYNIYRPQTRGEIYSSYHTMVEKRDGISKLEAQLIAQYEAIERDMDLGYETGKPKIIADTPDHWSVRFPSKFSISEHTRPPDVVVFIDKKYGTSEFFEQPLGG
jgi:hypothetical protein